MSSGPLIALRRVAGRRIAPLAFALLSSALLVTPAFGAPQALGADPAAVARLVIGSGLRLVVAGVAIGTAGAVAATRALSGMLFGVSAADPTTFAGTTLIVAVAALLASYVPAQRALRMDPAEVLRRE